MKPAGNSKNLPSSVVFGVVIAGSYEQSVIPLVAGFAVPGLAGVITMGRTEVKARNID